MSSTVYIPTGQDRVELCHPADDSDFDTITIGDLIDGTPRSQTWTPLAMELIHEDERKKLKRVSSPWLGGHALICRPEVFDVIGNYLKKSGELLPIKCPEAELYFFNTTRVIDALNEQASIIKRTSNGTIFYIECYVFDEESLKGVDMFKIPNLRASPTFVSGEFVEAWCNSQLTGLDFELVWDSSGPPIVTRLIDKMEGKAPLRKGKEATSKPGQKRKLPQ